MSDPSPEELLDTVNRCVSNFFDHNKFSAETMNTWQTALHQGKDCLFRPREVTPQNQFYIQVSIMVFRDQKTIVVNTMQLKGGDHTLIDSFQVSLYRIEGDVRDKLASVLTKVGLLSLPQMLQIRLIRNKIFQFLPVKDMLNLEATCNLVRDICSLREVDQSYWKKQLKKDFDKEKEDTQSTYREAYKQEAMKRKMSSSVSSSVNARRLDDDPLRIYDPLRDDRFVPRRPLQPDPMWPDPLNPFGPGVHNPNGPFFGGPGTGPELMPSRPQRFPQPRGPPGGMGPSGWPQFDRHDFI